LFLNRVRQAAEQGRAYRVHVETVPDRAGYVGAEGELCQSLATQIEMVGGQAYLVATLRDAQETLRQILRDKGVRTVVHWQHELLDQLHLDELLASEGITGHGHDELAPLDPETQRQIILGADAGISSVDFAIAETGTLAVSAQIGRERLTSLAPPIHIAVVGQFQIVPDLFDLFQKLNDRGEATLPSNLSLITGPSKTGDIELELTTGIHGPGQWIVVILHTGEAGGTR
jgi:L-lactate dehydrogenase complex protein LldG